MKKIITLLTFACFFVNVNAQTVFPNYQDGKIWFQVKNDYRVNASLRENPNNLLTSSLHFLSAIEKGHSIKNLSKPFHSAKSEKLQRIYLLEINDKENIDAVISALVATGKIEYAEKVPLDKLLLVPNDPNYSSQWALPKISAPAAWNLFSTGSTIVVGIVDDALERTHPDLSPNLWVNVGDNNSNGIDDDGNGYIDDKNGWDLADNDNDPNPTTLSFDHGTHVAGIVGAKGNNNTGVASIGFSVKLMPVKCSNSPGTISKGYEGIVYAVDNGADVINMSWGGYTSSTTGQSIIDYAYNSGVVLVAAAGNDNINTILYPAGYNHVIAVAASSSNDAKASFSNYGAWIDVTAPGENIYSTTVGGTYGNKSGTSMASPMTAGLAALMLSLNPYLTVDDVENCIETNTDNINAMNGSYIGMLGWGRINANLSMQCVNASLAWPPVADFAANFTTVTAGGSVAYTNLTKYAYPVTTYSWTFQGGTPATSTLQTPPSITYSTPGTYSVSLTVTNANGTNTKTNLSYITVNAAGGCLKINYPIPVGWTGTQYYSGASVGQNGWVNGVNSNNDKEKAMYFDASASPYTKLTNVWIGFGKASTGNNAKIVPVKIYDGSTGSPTTLLGTTNLTMGQIVSDVAGGFYTVAEFINNPVTLPVSKKFFVSVDVTNLSWSGVPKDTLSIVSNTQGQTVPSAIWDKNSSNLWQQYNTGTTWGLNASLYIHPWLTSEAPVAVFTQSSTSICQGNSITFNATGSTYEDTLLWYFPGGTPVVSNNLIQSAIYNTPGTYNAILYTVGGGCSQLDTAFVPITINANPTISVSATSTTICPAGTATLTAGGASTYSWAPPAGLSATTGTSVTATPTASTQYNVTGTGANGCTNTSTINITLQQPPVASLAAQSATGCEGAPYTYDGSLSTDANSFSWTLTGGSPAASSTPVGTTTYATPGTYTISLDVTNACGTNNAAQTVQINPLPTSVINTLSSVCAGDMFAADGSSSANATSYSWSFPGGSPAFGSFVSSGTSYATSGTYTMTLDASNSCGTATSTFTVTVNACLGVNQNTLSDLKIYYNNLNQQSVIEFPDKAPDGNYKVVLYNEIGQILYQTNIEVAGSQRQFFVNANNLAQGIYFIHLSGNEMNVVKKFVK